MAFSCKGRGLCPSCGAKRAAELAAFLNDEIVQEVSHAQWVFTVPKMLRVYFLYHRELLGRLSQVVTETVKELLSRVARGPHLRELENEPLPEAPTGAADQG